VRDNGIDLAAVRARPAALVLTAGVYLGRLTTPPSAVRMATGQRSRPKVRRTGSGQDGRPCHNGKRRRQADRVRTRQRQRLS
jgi:hypothetical protein